MTITNEDIAQWKTNPVTDWFFKEVSKMKAHNMNHLGSGGTLNTNSMENTFGSTAKIVGIIEGVDQILNIAIMEEE